MNLDNRMFRNHLMYHLNRWCVYLMEIEQKKEKEKNETLNNFFSLNINCQVYVCFVNILLMKHKVQLSYSLWLQKKSEKDNFGLALSHRSIHTRPY